MTIERLGKKLPARVGLYTTGHPDYWAQFPGMKERLLAYGEFIKERMGERCEVEYFGMVDTVDSGRRAGEFFNSKNVDLVFLHSGTYELSSGILPVHQFCTAPVVILNLQPCAEMDYANTSTEEWLSTDTACAIPEMCNVFTRCGIEFETISGLLGMEKDVVESITDCNTHGRPEATQAWADIFATIDAAMVVRSLKWSNYGFLGNFYGGMLDMYTDLTMFQSKTGSNVTLLEMSDLDKHLRDVTEAEVAAKRAEIDEFFCVQGDSAADPITKKPTEEQITWSAKIAVAQEKMVREHDLDGIAYYCRGYEDHAEDVQGGFILGHSLLTAAGVPCAGEGDIKTAMAMRICDLLGTGGSFCEIVTADFNKDMLSIGHDGPFHIDITNEKPIMRGMEMYHGKRGSGISVEASVTPGDVTMFAVVQAERGEFRFIASQGVAHAAATMQIGNTETHVDFGMKPVEFYDKWFKAAPTHHFALAVGHNIGTLRKIAALLEIEFIEV